MMFGKGFVSFNVTPQKIVYLQKITVTGSRFSACELFYQNPIKLPAQVQQTMTLDCSIKGQGSRATGSIMMQYYDKPDFKNVSVASGVFIAFS